MRTTKQVIIIRRDLKMRRGKEISQGAHASMGAFFASFNLATHGQNPNGRTFVDFRVVTEQDNPVWVWYKNSFTKITVTVQTEAELVALEQQAKTAGIPHCLIEDNGTTEFNGVKTKTALAIGPWWCDEIDKITGNLPLY